MTNFNRYIDYVDYYPPEVTSLGLPIRFRVPIKEGQEVTEDWLHEQWLEWKKRRRLNDRKE